MDRKGRTCPMGEKMGVNGNAKESFPFVFFFILLHFSFAFLMFFVILSLSLPFLSISLSLSLLFSRYHSLSLVLKKMKRENISSPSSFVSVEEKGERGRRIYILAL